MNDPRTTSRHGALMLVSADAGESLRQQVTAQARPCPEYLRLQDRHGVRLLDWSRLAGGPHRRSVGLSVRHAGAALAQLPHADVVLSDGEHVGIPLALAMQARRCTTPHIVIGHHLGSPRKAPIFRWAKAHRKMDRVLVHSPNQIDLLHRKARLLPRQLRLVPVRRGHRILGSRPACGGLGPGPLHRPRASRPPDADRRGGGHRQPFRHRQQRPLPSGPPARATGLARVGRAPGAQPSGSARAVRPGRRSSSCRCCPRRIPSASPRCSRPWPWPSPWWSPTPRACAASSSTDGLVWSCRPATPPPCGAPYGSCSRTPTPAKVLGQAARAAVIGRFGLDQFVDELGRHLDEVAGTPRTPELEL